MPNDHVVDEGAGQAVLGVSLTGLVVGGDEDLLALLRDGDEIGERALKLALGALDVHGGAVDCHSDSGGNLDRLLANAGHSVSFPILP